MASNYQVNIVIQAGVDFNQEFYLTNPDRSPRNITGYKFNANISKHPRSIDVTLTTEDKTYHKLIPCNTRVVNGQKGIFAISLSADITKYLREGKYVYSCTMRDRTGARSEAVGGLCFVEVATGYLSADNGDEIIFDGGGSSAPENMNIFDGGSA